MKITLNGKDFNSNVADANGTQWYVTGWDGWDSPDIRQSFAEPTSKHGEVVAAGLYSARSMSLQGIVKATSEQAFWIAYYELQALTAELRSPFDMVVWEPVPKRVRVVRSGRLLMTVLGGSSFEFDLALKAPDPMKYGLGETVMALAAGATVSATHQGTYYSFPTFHVGGTVNLVNNTTGQIFTANSVPAGSLLDFNARTLYNGTVNHFDKISPSSVWWPLTPGANSVENAGSAATMYFYPTWI